MIRQDGVALITGGARGIGRSIGLKLAEFGWSVGLAYRTSHSEADAACRDIEERGGKALAVQADVSDPAQCAHLVDTIEKRWDGIDALIHCAGPYHRVDILSETPEGWRTMFANNLDSLFYMARLVAPGMIERSRGRIIAFSMANADRLVAQPQVTAHYLAKAGVLGLVRTLSRALARNRVTVNAISPGFIDSGSMGADELKSIVKNIPAGQVGKMDDVTAAVLYLLSEEASYVTGANLQISGGWGL